MPSEHYDESSMSWTFVIITCVVAMISGLSASIAFSTQSPGGQGALSGAAEWVLHISQALLWYRTMSGDKYSPFFWWTFITIPGLVRACSVALEAARIATPIVLDARATVHEDGRASRMSSSDAAIAMAVPILQFILFVLVPWMLFAHLNLAWERRKDSARDALKHAIIALKTPVLQNEDEDDSAYNRRVARRQLKKRNTRLSKLGRKKSRRMSHASSRSKRGFVGLLTPVGHRRASVGPVLTSHSSFHSAISSGTSKNLMSRTDDAVVAKSEAAAAGISLQSAPMGFFRGDTEGNTALQSKLSVRSVLVDRVDTDGTQRSQDAQTLARNGSMYSLRGDGGGSVAGRSHTRRSSNAVQDALISAHAAIMDAEEAVDLGSHDSDGSRSSRSSAAAVDR